MIAGTAALSHTHTHGIDASTYECHPLEQLIISNDICKGSFL